jgi:antibiotic biosynthesis monooxygenase (ABM) superfamily enzyme
MVQIASGNDVVTLINVFTVSPENQQKLIDMLVEATQKTMRHIPGFVSASFHKSATAHASRTTRNGAKLRTSRPCFGIREQPST